MTIKDCICSHQSGRYVTAEEAAATITPCALHAVWLGRGVRQATYTLRAELDAAIRRGDAEWHRAEKAEKELVRARGAVRRYLDCKKGDDCDEPHVDEMREVYRLGP